MNEKKNQSSDEIDVGVCCFLRKSDFFRISKGSKKFSSMNSGLAGKFYDYLYDYSVKQKGYLFTDISALERSWDFFRGDSSDELAQGIYDFYEGVRECLGEEEKPNLPDGLELLEDVAEVIQFTSLALGWQCLVHVEGETHWDKYPCAVEPLDISAIRAERNRHD
jgi:hypothetical protein